MSAVFLAPTPTAGTGAASCRVTLRVKNCSGEPLAEVRVEVQSGSEGHEAITDQQGRVSFELCADDVGEVSIYLFEGGSPMSSSPSFDEDASAPGQATADVVVC
jgi:hypothetical protein